MSELSEILRKEYKKKEEKKPIDFSMLMEMVEQLCDAIEPEVVNDDTLPLQETAQVRAKDFLLVLPKFIPTEAWGDPNSMERQQINRLFAVMGGARTIEGKLGFLQRIAEPGTRIVSPRRIISSLILLESLSAVINSFNAASAGFVFEGFLAALLQGRQEAEVSAKGNLPIQDLIAFTESDNPVPISLKLLNLTTNIEGSYTNLIDALDEFGQMIYIVARKDGEAIVIEEFTFDQENFIMALSTSARGGLTKRANLFQIEGLSVRDSMRLLQGESVQYGDDVVELSGDDWAAKYALLQRTAGYSQRVRKKRETLQAQEIGGLDQDPDTSLEEVIRQEWNLLTESRGETQWSISPSQLKSYDFVDYKTLGTLPYSAAQIEKVAEMHMDKLNTELFNLFTATMNLSENINKYFTFDKRSRAINAAEKGIEDTVEIQQALTAQIGQTPQNNNVEPE